MPRTKKVSKPEKVVADETSSEEKHSHLQGVFYLTGGMWKGWSAITKLQEAAGVSREEAEAFLRKQALWQVFLPPPRKISRPHWMVDEPNAMHQADLLFLPKDEVFGKTFRYALVVVDVASRFKDAAPLQTKQATEVAKAFKKIYSRTLKYPAVIVVDDGSEFKGDVKKMFEFADKEIRRSEPKNHRAQAFVERANRTGGEDIHASGSGRNGKGMKLCVKVVGGETAKDLGNSQFTPTRLTGQKPLEAFAKESLPLKEIKYSRPVGFAEKKLPLWVSVRFLLKPGELHGGEVRRATDPFRSLDVFEIEKMRVSANQPILYYFEDGPKRSFVREQLQVVPEGTVAPPKGLLKKIFD